MAYGALGPVEKSRIVGNDQKLLSPSAFVGIDVHAKFGIQIRCVGQVIDAPPPLVPWPIAYGALGPVEKSRIVGNAPRLWIPSTFVGIDVHAKFRIQIRCVGQVIDAPPPLVPWPIAYGALGPVEKSRIVGNAPRLSIPSTFVGIDVHENFGVQIRCVGQVIGAPVSRPVARQVIDAPPPLVPWPIAYGALGPVEKSRIVGNAPRLWIPSTFVGIDVHAKVGIQIRCVGQVINAPPPLVPWPIAYGALGPVEKSRIGQVIDAPPPLVPWPIAYGALGPVEKSRIVGNAPRLWIPSRFVGIDVHAKFGIQIRCVGQVIDAPPPLVPWPIAYGALGPVEKSRIVGNAPRLWIPSTFVGIDAHAKFWIQIRCVGQVIDAPPPLVPWPIAYGALGQVIDAPPPLVPWPIAYGALGPVEKSRIVGNAPRLWIPSTFVGIDVHANFGVQIRCVGQVIGAPASRPAKLLSLPPLVPWPMAYGALGPVEKSRIVGNDPKLLSPSAFVGIDVHAKFGIQIRCVGQVIDAPPPLVPWPIAYGALGPVEKSRIVGNAPRLWIPSTFVGIDVHAKFGIQIRCVGQVIDAPPPLVPWPIAYGALGPVEKSRIVGIAPRLWIPSTFVGIDVHENFGVQIRCAKLLSLPPLVPWHMAYGALGPVDKSRIVGNDPRLWSPSTFVEIDVHAKFGVQIRCVGQVIVAPASRPAKLLSLPPFVSWPMAYGELGPVEKSRNVENDPKLLSPSTFVGIDVHAKFGIQIRCVGQVIDAPPPLVLWPIAYRALGPVEKSRIGQVIDAPPPLVPWPIAYGALGPVEKSRIFGNAPRLWIPSTFVGIDVHAKFGIQIRCVGQVIDAPPPLVPWPIAYGALGPVEKSRIVGNAPRLWIPSTFVGIDVHAKFWIQIRCVGQVIYAPPPLVPWPIAYGALGPVEKSRIVGNAPRLWIPSTFVGIEVHENFGVQIRCVGQVINAPVSRPVARQVIDAPPPLVPWPIAYGALGPVEKSRIVGNAPRLWIPSTFVGIDVHAKFGIQIRCVGQVINAPPPLVPWPIAYGALGPVEKSRIGQVIDAPPPLVPWPIAYGALGPVEKSRIVRNAPRLWIPSRFVGIDVHAKFGIQIRCVGQVIDAPPPLVPWPIAYGALGPVEKSRIVGNAPRLWIPSTFVGIDAHAKFWIQICCVGQVIDAPPPLVPWPIAYGALGQVIDAPPPLVPWSIAYEALGPVEKSRIVGNAPRLWIPSTFVGIDVHANLGVQIRCVGQVIGAPASRPAKLLSLPPLVPWPMAYGALGPVEKSRIVGNDPKLLSPSAFVGIDVHAKFGIQIRCVGQVIDAPPPLVPWPIAYGALGPVEKSRIIGNDPRLWIPSTFVGIDVHAKFGIQIRCVGQVIDAPPPLVPWPIAYGALGPVEKSRIVGNAPRLWIPSTFVGIDVHENFGVQIRCVGQVIGAPVSRPVANSLWSTRSGRKIEDCQVIDAPPPLVPWPIAYRALGPVEKSRIGQVIDAPPPLVPWPIAYGALGPVEKSRIVGNAPRLWIPSRFVGIDVHAKFGIQIRCVGLVIDAPPPLVPWPIAYGALGPVEKSRIVGNAPRLWIPSTFVGIDVHANFGVQIRCVGQVIGAPVSRPVARPVEKSRIVGNAPRLWIPSTFVGIDVHAKFGIQIRCVGQVIDAPPPLVPWPIAYGKLGPVEKSRIGQVIDAPPPLVPWPTAYGALGPVEKSRIVGNAPRLWIPSTFVGICVHAKFGIQILCVGQVIDAPPPLVPWPIAYGALGPVEKSRIVGNAPRLWIPSTFVGIDVHENFGVQIRCVGQVIGAPVSRPVAPYGALDPVEKSRIVGNAPRLWIPSTFVGIDVHAKFGIQIRCVGQVIDAPPPLVPWPIAYGALGPVEKSRIGQVIDAPPPLVPWPIAYGALGPVEKSRIVGNAPRLWIPSRFVGIDVHAKFGIQIRCVGQVIDAPPPLVPWPIAYGALGQVIDAPPPLVPWPIAYGALGPVEKSRIVGNAPRLWIPSTFVGIDVHAKFWIQIRCVGQVIDAPPPLVPWPIAYGALGPVEKSRIVGNAPRLWIPSTFVGIDVHAKFGIQIRCVGQVIDAPPPLVPWPIAYGAPGPVEKSRIVGNAPRLWIPSTFVGIDVHAKFGIQIRCVGQVIDAPPPLVPWPIAYGALGPVEKSRIVGNAQRFWIPSTFVGINVHANFGVQIRCVGQVIGAPASRPVA
ncbi:hypothetical protein KIW84_040459 [Lathyrus oleraceus]|uniref:Uncharacterized protein n=1 Tax=Pisum sativum TaxID=3888 RepID=A0A9D4XA27_PEA|nr:hypothetical protein KIW84_040459 [Pisum sativum]